MTKGVSVKGRRESKIAVLAALAGTGADAVIMTAAAEVGLRPQSWQQ